MPIVCRVSVSGANVVKYLVANVLILFPVKLECHAFGPTTPTPIMMIMLFAILMPEKAAL
jgi:hypothetical protein